MATARTLGSVMFEKLKRWWNQPGNDLSAALDAAFAAGEKAAKFECAELCRAEGRYWSTLGVTDTRDFELCALRIEQSSKQ